MSNEKEMNRLKELLRRRDKVILEQAQEIAELKQKLLRRAATSAQQSTDHATYNHIKLSDEMNAKAVMSFGLEMVGFGAKRQNVRDKLNVQRFRSHFGVSPDATVDIITDMLKHGKKRDDSLLSHLMMT